MGKDYYKVLVGRQQQEEQEQQKQLVVEVALLCSRL
jgi:hypothetical protein